MGLTNNMFLIQAKLSRPGEKAKRFVFKRLKI